MSKERERFYEMAKHLFDPDGWVCIQVPGTDTYELLGLVIHDYDWVDREFYQDSMGDA